MQKPFVRGARGPETYDCHGLTIEVFKRYGIQFPDVDIAGMAVEAVTSMLNEKIDYHVRVLKDWEPIQEPKAPCLIVLRGVGLDFANHLAVYIGGGKFIHAKEHYGVCVSRLSDRKNSLRGFYRYVGK